MAAKYTPITLTEMTDLLVPKGWYDATPSTSREHVLHWRCKRYADNIVLKVYTSIATAHGQGRSKGKDAIRVCAVNLTTDKGLIASKRVHRVENWRENLLARIKSVFMELKTWNLALAPPPTPVAPAPEPKADAAHPSHCWCVECMINPPITAPEQKPVPGLVWYGVPEHQWVNEEAENEEAASEPDNEIASEGACAMEEEDTPKKIKKKLTVKAKYQGHNA